MFIFEPDGELNPVSLMLKSNQSYLPSLWDLTVLPEVVFVDIRVGKPTT